jgi:MerR family transcriptional regulator/heat shock protein HspR
MSLPASSSSSSTNDWPVIEADPGAVYSLETMSQLSGISSALIAHYYQEGLIQAVPGEPLEPPSFNDDALRMVRRLESIRDRCGVNQSGLRFLARLLEELDWLRVEVRRRS